MKIDAARIDPYLKAPNLPLALIYGPDTGLVAERALALVRAIPGAMGDPFRFAELQNPDPGTFLAEATAAAMTGERRVLRVRDCADVLAKPLESLLAALPDALIILEAGELTPKSKLRALAEKSAAIATIACYPADPARLPGLITARLRESGMRIDSDAAAWTAANTPADAALLSQTIELLTLYAGAERHLTLADVTAALPDGGGVSMSDAIDASLTGDITGTDRALTLAYEEGQSPVGILRVLLGELMRLRLAAASMATGTSASQAMAAIRPPVFFKRQPIVTRILGLWSLAGLTEAIAAALRAETAVKQTLIPDEAFCRQTLLALATRARAAARR
ncbi:MAG: DNA polymerase III subunit delta [Acidocella sp.]|nr:DNA polymerase III subunit delta [Acidocella sp.]